jgi:hypothetical protein
MEERNTTPPKIWVASGEAVLLSEFQPGGRVGMDVPGFHVEIGTLKSASAGIEESVADQKGSALSHLDRAESVYGHDRLHKSMENFCDRWSDGIDILIKDARVIGDLLGKVADAYQAADAAAVGRLTTDPGKPVVDD